MTYTNFTTQLQGHRPSLQIFAQRFTQDVDDANDLVQDTFLKAIKYAAMYNDGTNLKGWLYTIMRNTFINDYRRSMKRKSVLDTEEDLTSKHLLKSASSNKVEGKFISEDINRALSLLNSDCRTAFVQYFEGYKYHEIALELGIPIGTVKTRIHVARQLLKKNLKMYSQEFGQA